MSSTPLWQAGHLYTPGDLVQPIQAPAVSLAAITNPGFETGDATGWTLPGGASVESGDAYSGTYRLEFTGTAGQIRAENTAVAVSPGTVINASAIYQQGGASAGDNVGRVVLIWFDAGSVEISESLGSEISSGSNGAWHQSTVTGTAPYNAAEVAIGFRVNRTDSSESSVDVFSWNLTTAGALSGLIFKAVQAAPGHSAEVEPAWPATLGLTVVDFEVTWEAVQGSRVVWTAFNLLVSGGSEPTWPTEIGASVSDGSISWECISRRVEDEKCPNTRVVAILSSKVFAADGDIIKFCATANPLDWTAENDAGYLPSGLQQANANEISVLAPYRSNLAAMNPAIFQNWQVDPDPALMSILDQMDGVGSSYQGAAQPVANDLFYLAALGVRSVGISVGAENLSAGDIGMPIDELVQAAMAGGGGRAISTYYPSRGQYWLSFRGYTPPGPRAGYWWLTQGDGSGAEKSKVYRASSALDGWLPTTGFEKVSVDASNESIYQMLYTGAAVLLQHFHGAGNQDAHEQITTLDPSGATVDAPWVSIPYATSVLRRDCINSLVAYGPQVLTLDGGVTLQALTQPTSGVLSGEDLYDLVRTGSGRWLGIGQGTTGREFVYTDEAVPTTWINAGRLPGVGGVNVGGTNEKMDASASAVIVLGAAGAVYRSDNTGLAFALVQTLSGNGCEVKWLGGTRWVISTFDTQNGSGTGDRLWFSSDDGLTFVVASASSVINASGICYVSLAFDGVSTLLIGAEHPAATATTKLWKTTDFGATITEVTLPADFLTGYGTSCLPCLTWVPSA